MDVVKLSPLKICEYWDCSIIFRSKWFWIDADRVLNCMCGHVGMSWSQFGFLLADNPVACDDDSAKLYV